jgi:predicted nucleotidyltransferase/HEPN domain-containing protein
MPRMKTDLSHLPEDKREELADIARVVREAVDPEMVILFGSHARGDWVEDEVTGYVSDYDILIVTRPKHEEGGSNRLPERVESQVAEALRHRNVNAIAHDIDFVNSRLGEGRYFFVDIVREGVLLYDSGRYRLAKPRMPDDAERKRLAEEDLAHWSERARSFYLDFEGAMARGDPLNSAFLLHQATERYYTTILLVFTHYKPRTHDIERLDKQARLHVAEVARVFPRSTPEEEKRFDLLKRAYIDARYEKS